MTRFTKKTQSPRDKKTQIGNWKKIPIRIPASGKPEKNLHYFSNFSILARKFIFFRPLKRNFRGRNCGRKTRKKTRNFPPFFPQFLFRIPKFSFNFCSATCTDPLPMLIFKQFLYPVLVTCFVAPSYSSWMCPLTIFVKWLIVNNMHPEIIFVSYKNANNMRDMRHVYFIA